MNPRAVVALCVLSATLGFGALASAEVLDFKASEPLSAAKMNGNFKELADRIASLEAGKIIARRGNKSYSVGATTFCGKTTIGHAGAAVGGYGGAKTKCEGVANCSASAHFCGEDEIVRSLALGIGIELGLATSGWIHGAGGVGANVPVNQITNDCNGFTKGVPGGPASGFYGKSFSINVEGSAGASPFMYPCEYEVPLLCCD
jgi:hypothetical protein